jgi:L-lactate permease
LSTLGSRESGLLKGLEAMVVDWLLAALPLLLVLALMLAFHWKGSQAGPRFPFISISIGALGAFMTGSSANSSVILGVLQEQTALLVGMSATLALTAQALGGALGGILVGAKIMLGCATVKADEPAALRKTLAYGLVILTLMAVLIWAVHLAC